MILLKKTTNQQITTRYYQLASNPSKPVGQLASKKISQKPHQLTKNHHKANETSYINTTQLSSNTPSHESTTLSHNRSLNEIKQGCFGETSRTKHKPQNQVQIREKPSPKMKPWLLIPIEVFS